MKQHLAQVQNRAHSCTVMLNVMLNLLQEKKYQFYFCVPTWDLQNGSAMPREMQRTVSVTLKSTVSVTLKSTVSVTLKSMVSVTLKSNSENEWSKNYLLNTHTVSVTQKGNLKNEWREKPFTEQTHYPTEVASALLLTFLHILFHWHHPFFTFFILFCYVFHFLFFSSVSSSFFIF